jgi:hypothetical protein
MYCLCVNVYYGHRVTTQLQLTNISYHVQHLEGQNFAALTIEEWAAVCRHVKAVEGYMSRARDGQLQGNNHNQRR